MKREIPPPVASLLERFVTGEHEAADRIFRQYGPLVMRIVRRRLSKRTPRFDSGDVAQAVWASFFAKRTQLLQFSSDEDVARYLTAMATKKVQRFARDNFLAQKRSADREVLREDDGEIDDVQSDAPSPSQVAIAGEVWDALLARLSFSQQRILVMRLQGRSVEEIARDCGISTRTLNRLLARLLERAVA